MSRYGYLEVFHSPLEFEITRVDCSVDPDDVTACNEPFIRIYTICHSDFDFRLKHQIALVDKSKFKDGRFHFRNSGMKGFCSEEKSKFHCVLMSDFLSIIFFFFFFFFFLLGRLSPLSG